jgi:hypothetical protein
VAVNRIAIKFNGKEVTNPSSSVWVGEPILLQAIVKGPQVLQQIGNPHWTVPTKAIAEYRYDDTKGEVIPLTETDKNSDLVELYWVDSGLKTVTFSGSINGVASTKNTAFDVHRPTATVSTQTTDIFRRGSQVEFGKLGPSVPPGERAPGISFSATIDAAGDAAGDLEWAQVVSDSIYAILESGQPIRHIAANDIDDGYPYDTGKNTEDSPSSELLDPRYLQLFGEPLTEYRRHVDFSMYLMWTSNTAGSIPVPLRRVDWFIDFTASSNNLINWNLDSSDHSVNPPDHDTTDYPTWDGLAQSAPWEYDD